MLRATGQLFAVNQRELAAAAACDRWLFQGLHVIALALGLVARATRDQNSILWRSTSVWRLGRGGAVLKERLDPADPAASQEQRSAHLRQQELVKLRVHAAVCCHLPNWPQWQGACGPFQQRPQHHRTRRAAAAVRGGPGAQGGRSQAEFRCASLSGPGHQS